jgi:hypothetical protein
VPARNAKSGRRSRRHVQRLCQIEQHELAYIKPKSKLTQRMIHRPAEGHQLRFNPRKIRQRPHTVQHFFQQTACNRGLIELRRNIESADQSFRLFHHVKRIAGCSSVFIGHAAGKGMRLQEALNELQRPAIVPMEFIAPMEGFFFQQGFNLADCGLAQVYNVHEG